MTNGSAVATNLSMSPAENSGQNDATNSEIDYHFMPNPPAPPPEADLPAPTASGSPPHDGAYHDGEGESTPPSVPVFTEPAAATSPAQAAVSTTNPSQ